VGDTYRAVIPYESMDPLTIGASDDETKKYRDQLELEIPTRNLLAAIYPGRARARARRDRGRAAGAGVAAVGPAASRSCWRASRASP
jgi:hypothetical protein